MARPQFGIFDLIDRNKPAEKAEVAKVIPEDVPPEIAATIEQQRMMEKAGELQPVQFIGPGNSLIRGFYSPVERAFLPEFIINED